MYTDEALFYMTEGLCFNSALCCAQEIFQGECSNKRIKGKTPPVVSKHASVIDCFRLREVLHLHHPYYRVKLYLISQSEKHINQILATGKPNSVDL